MNINCNRFRLSSYQEHKVTGFPKNWRISFVTYNSADNGGKQRNYSLTIGFITLHLKLRMKALPTEGGKK